MSDTMTDPLLGRVIDGRYEVRDRVAAGGMATVYLAFDRHLEREVALKVMHRHLEVDPNSHEFVARFRKEAKSAARLTHPGVVRVYDQGVDEDVSYLTMEYVAGQNLREHLRRTATLPLGEALSTAEHVLDALASAHRQGLVHQDVKPENVLIDTDGRPRVTDFGLARAATEVAATTSGMLLGTVAYLGPELISSGTSDARTDVYAVGVLLYEMITGVLPHVGDTPEEIAAKHINEDIPSPSATVAWLPPEVDTLVARLTSRDPGRRPADAGEAAAAVRSTVALMDDPTLARRADPPSGAIATLDPDATTVLDDGSPGATVALPIGAGQHRFPAVGSELAMLPDDDPEAREPVRGRRRSRAGWWVAAVLVALAVLGGGTFWWYNSIGPGAYTTVPPVTTQTVENAQTVLRSVGLVPEVEEVFDYDVPEGLVVSSNPAAQRRVLDGSTITLEVSQGPPMATVPATVGQQRDQVEAALAELGFPLGEVTEEFSDTVPEGEVMESTPESGTTIRDDTPVSLTVSIGPEPITFPDVSGMTQEEAEAALEELALDVTVERERTEEAEEGLVFAQSPEAGAEGRRTDEVTITVSDGPPLVTVGDYVGDDYDAAVAAARDAGLEVSVYGKWPWSSRDTISDQSITPGTRVEKGQGITLVYN